MSRYYDRSGNLIALMAWAALVEDADYWLVALDQVGDAEVSTVWLGLDHNFGVGPPLIFDTMIIGGVHDGEQWRYTTETEARDGHNRVVMALRNGEAP